MTNFEAGSCPDFSKLRFQETGDERVILRYILGAAIGLVIGGAVGYLGKCAGST